MGGGVPVVSGPCLGALGVQAREARGLGNLELQGSPGSRGLGFRSLGFRVQGFRVQGFRIQGFRFRVYLDPR